MLPHVWNLRSRRGFRELSTAFAEACNRAGFRLIHFSVQGNHLHLIVEAADAVRLSRGLQGLAVRIARRLNRLMGRAGKVFADRFHQHVLRSPVEVARAVARADRAAPCLSSHVTVDPPAGSLSAWRRRAMQPGGVSANDTGSA